MMSLFFSVPCIIFFAARLFFFKTIADMIFFLSFVMVALVDVFGGNRVLPRVFCGLSSASMCALSLFFFSQNAVFDVSYLIFSALWFVILLVPVFSDSPCVSSD